MTRYFWTYEEREAYNKGRRDEDYHRKDFDYDKYRERETDKAYFQGHEDRKREIRERREEERREEERQEMLHRQRMREEYELEWMRQQEYERQEYEAGQQEEKP